MNLSDADELLSRLSLPKAILQLAWRPVEKEGKVDVHTLAVASEDCSLRLFSFDDTYLRQ